MGCRGRIQDNALDRIMKEWNVVVTVPEHAYNQSRAFLRQLGDVDATGFYNVLTMDVPDIGWFLDKLADRIEARPAAAELISHLAPAQQAFDFHSPEEFEVQVVRTAKVWLPELAGRRFHVRMHRRGFKGSLDSRHEEQLLGGWLMDELAARGTPAAIDFDDPDAVIAVDTVHHRVGMALWTREDLQRFPFLDPE